MPSAGLGTDLRLGEKHWEERSLAVIRFVFRLNFVAACGIALGGLLIDQRAMAAEASLTDLPENSAGNPVPAAFESASDIPYRPSRSAPAVLRVQATGPGSNQSSPMDVPAPIDPEQVLPSDGEPRQRPGMNSNGAPGSAMVSDHGRAGGNASASDNSGASGRLRNPNSSSAAAQTGAGCDNNAPGNPWCDQSCGNCWPKWYVQAGAEFLWRDNRSGIQPVVQSTSGNTIFDTHSADFDTGIGPRILLGMRTTECDAWEVQYFSALDFSGQADIDSPGDLTAPGDFSQLAGWTDANHMHVDYTSELHNIEINYLHTWGRLSILAGFRFVRLTDDFGLRSTSILNDPGGADLVFLNNSYHVHSENNLYGAQLGGRYRICCDQFFCEFTGKAGLFGNDLNQSQYLTADGGSQVVRNFTVYDGTTALVADMNISAGFRLNCVWAFRCGYNLMWVDQVALAADQLNFTLASDAGTHVEKRGDVFLQGIDVGLEGRW
jgi:Putative beta barrel porin-7 (BBP7)